MSGLWRAAQRIKVTGGTGRQRCTMMASVLFGWCLYGPECHYTAQKKRKAMWRVMGTAMGDAEGRRPDGVRLLFCGGGRWDPEVVRVKRLVKQWQAESDGDKVPKGYWDSLAGAKGNHGPISLMRHTLEQAGAGCSDPEEWGTASLCDAMTRWRWKWRKRWRRPGGVGMPHKEPHGQRS